MWQWHFHKTGFCETLTPFMVVHPQPDLGHPVVSPYLRTKSAASFRMSIKLSNNNGSYIYFVFESFSLSFTSLANGSIHHINNVIRLLRGKEEKFVSCFLGLCWCVMFSSRTHCNTVLWAVLSKDHLKPLCCATICENLIYNTVY